MVKNGVTWCNQWKYLLQGQKTHVRLTRTVNCATITWKIIRKEEVNMLNNIYVGIFVNSKRLAPGGTAR